MVLFFVQVIMCSVSGRFKNFVEENADEQAMIEGDHGDEGSDEYTNLTKNFWNEEEIERLVDGIAEHQNDWEAISKEVFDELKNIHVDMFGR